jgi:uncharacterized protein YbdZ (MbtH family)
MLILNPRDTLANPVIVNNETGVKDSLNIQPLGRVHVPDGWTLDQEWKERNADLKYAEVA